MIALGLWSRRPIAAANAATLLAGMALIGLTTFLPMYVQGVLGRSPLVAGFALTMMVLGWPAGATLAARALRPRSACGRIAAGRQRAHAGRRAAFVLLGTGARRPWLAGVGSLVMGFGMGLLSTASIVLIQDIVDWSQRGSATASNIFSRNLGSTLGAAVLGAVLNYGLAHAAAGGVTSVELRRLLDSASGGAVAAQDGAVRIVLHQSLHLTFGPSSALALVITLLAALVPPVRFGHPQPQGAPAE